MKKLVIFLSLLSLLSCKVVDDYKKDLCSDSNSDCYEKAFDTSSIVPDDIESSDAVNSAVIAKAQTYINDSYDASSDKHDSYGFIFGKEGSTFMHQGDGLMWNSVPLAAMCMMDSSSDYTFTTEIASLWNAIKTEMIMSDGRPRRHPLKDGANGTSISRDMVTGYLYMGAMAKYTNCSGVTSDYLTYLEKVRDYAINNNWELQNPAYLEKANSTTTKMGDNTKRMMVSVLKIYGGDYSSIVLDNPDINAMTAEMKLADWIAEKKFYCRQGFIGSCLKGANLGVFGAHLTFLHAVTANIEYKLLGSSTYFSEFDLDTLLYDAARIGNSVNHQNWLMVAAYRHFTGGTFNDVYKALDEIFPDVIPGEIEGTNSTTRGCTDFIWQRIGWEYCSGSSEVYTGNDFLQAFAWSKI